MMTTAARVAWSGVVTGAMLALWACQKSLPTAPSALMTGAIVYEHANYLGASAHITQDVRHLKDFSGPCE